MADKKLTAKDLSRDQREVYETMSAWSEGDYFPDSGDGDLLTVGGLAGCLSGDTIVRYNRGARAGARKISLRDLYLKFNGFAGSGRGQAQRWVDLTMPTYLQSFWPDGTVAHNRIIGVFESGVKEVLRLDFEGHRHLVATPDHPIATPGGAFVPAGELRVGDVVWARGTLKSAKGEGRNLKERPPRVIVNVKYHPGGARKTVVCNGIAYDYARVARARLVVEAALNDLPYDEFVHALKHNPGLAVTFRYLAKGLDVHHLDENTLNDDIDNLEVLPHKEHARIHGEEENEFNLRKDYTRELRVVRAQRAAEEMTYDVQMEPPANNFAANDIFVHNTGKTTLVGVFAASTKATIAYVSFTGRASSILGRKLKAAGVVTTGRYRQTRTEADRAGDENDWSYPPGHPEEKLPFCGTIHRLLYKPIINEKMELIGWRKRDQLDRKYDLIVVDEASMVGKAVLEDLRVHNVPVLAVGDHGQLPPVADSSDLMQEPDLRLEKIHRQAEGNPIIHLAHMVREGEWLPMVGTSKGKATWRDARVTIERKDAFEKVFLDAAKRVKSPLDVGVLCWTNKTRVRLNATCRAAFGHKGLPLKREPLICLYNRPPVFNGMRGVLTTDCERSQKVAWWLVGDLEFPDEELPPSEYTFCSAQFLRDRTFETIDELRTEARINVESMPMAGDLYDFGYCLTVHKSQGSQFEHAIVYLDRREDPSNEEYRRWIYTAVTRAAERLTVLR